MCKGKQYATDNQITVSVVCLVYNHALYLKKCLDGIVGQKTNFSLEVIVNDDASTDNSKEIISEYEKKYPDLIKAIYHKENQWIKGVNIIRSVLFHAKGRYVAVCDGDDYWTDENKLQKQFEFMESHKECSMCAHKMLTVDARTEEGLFFIPKNNFEKKEIYTIRDFLKSGYFIQTTSYFVRGTVVEEYCKSLPKFIELCPAGDTALLMWCAYKGNVGYIDEKMGCYRLAVKNSWSEQLKENEEKRKSFYEGLIACYEEFDKVTKEEYHEEISHSINYLAVVGNCREDLLRKGDIKRRRRYQKREKLKSFIQTKLKFVAKIWYKRQTKEPKK